VCVEQWIFEKNNAKKIKKNKKKKFVVGHGL